MVSYAVLGLRVVRNVASMVVEWSDRFLEILRLPKLMRVPSRSSSTPHCLLEEPRAAWVVPVRGHLDSIARLMAGDQYIGRGCRQWGWRRISSVTPTRVNAIRMFAHYLDKTAELIWQVPLTDGTRSFGSFVNCTQAPMTRTIRPREHRQQMNSTSSHATDKSQSVTRVPRSTKVSQRRTLDG